MTADLCIAYLLMLIPMTQVDLDIDARTQWEKISVEEGEEKEGEKSEGEEGEEEEEEERKEEEEGEERDR